MAICWVTACRTEWLEEVRKADEDSLLELSDHLPREAADDVA